MPETPQRRPSLLPVLIPTLADVLGYGLMLPVLPTLIARLTGSDIATAALYGGWLAFSFAVMQVFFAPLLGSLGDKLGRRPVLLLSLFPLAIDALMLSLAPAVGWLFAGKIAGGTIGGSYGVASAYVADITQPAKRARNFALLNAAVGCGGIAGPVIGGLLASRDPYLPCYIAAALSVANILFTLFFVPESLPAANRRPLQWKCANPLGAVSNLRKHPVIWGLVVALGCYYIAADAMESVWSYFTIEKFSWNEQTIGYSLGLMGLLFAVTQGFVCLWLLPRLGNKRSIFVGLMVQAAAMLGFALATRGWMLMALMLPYAAGTIFGPAIQSTTANLTAPNRQGQLQGGLSALRNITSIIGPLAMTGLFSLFTGPHAPFYFPGMPFVFSALVLGLALLVVRRTFAGN